METKPNTRQSILDTAAALFHSQNYADVGIATICSQAGVSKGSFFHFFPSKRDLAIAVLEQFRSHINQTLVASAFTPGKPPLERLESFVTELYVFQKDQAKLYGHMPGCPFGNIILEQANRDELLRQKADSCLRSLGNHFHAAVSDAVQDGSLPAVDEQATADAMLSYIEGIQLMAKARNQPELIQQLGPAITTIRVPL